MTQATEDGNLIVFIDDAHTFGGAQIALAWAIRTLLSETPNRVLCVTTGRTRKAIEQVAGNSPRLQFIECPPALPLNILTFVLRVPAFVPLLLRIRKREVHTWWLSLPDIQFCLAPLVILRCLGQAPIGWLHNTERAIFFFPQASCWRRGLSRLRDWLSEKFVFRLYPLLLTPSQATASALSVQLGDPPRPRLGHLYYPPIGDQSSPTALAKDATAPVPAQSLQLWMIGRIDYGHKNNRLVLDLLSYLTRRGIVASLVIVGDGPDRADLEASTRKLGLHGSVSFVGWQADPWSSVPPNAVVVIPSLYESMCIVAREAMTHRIALVVSPIDVFHEWIPAPLIASGFTTEAFAETLFAVQRLDPADLRGMYVEALARFSADSFTQAFDTYSTEVGVAMEQTSVSG